MLYSCIGDERGERDKKDRERERERKEGQMVKREVLKTKNETFELKYWGLFSV